MRRQLLTVVSIVSALVSFARVLADAKTSVSDRDVPQTVDGRPDLQGVCSNNRATKLERPEQFADKATLTDEEQATTMPSG